MSCITCITAEYVLLQQTTATTSIAQTAFVHSLKHALNVALLLGHQLLAIHLAAQQQIAVQAVHTGRQHIHAYLFCAACQVTCLQVTVITACYTPTYKPTGLRQVWAAALNGVFEVWLFCYFSRVGGKQGVAAPVAALPYMPAAFMLYTSDFCYTTKLVKCRGLPNSEATRNATTTAAGWLTPKPSSKPQQI